MAEKQGKEKKISFGGALVVLIFLCVAMFLQIFVLHKDWVTHITLLLGCVVAAVVIPTLIYYGLKILSPNVFLLTVCFVCCMASLATGSSWTTGLPSVTFIGMGLNIPPAVTAGAVISGAISAIKYRRSRIRPTWPPESRRPTSSTMFEACCIRWGRRSFCRL
jgi:NhaC family Na+:H+ antiporter